MKHEMTIDDLARAVADGFGNVDTRLNHIEAHFDVVNARFDEVNAKLARVENRLNSLDDRILADLTLRVARLEKQLAA